MSYDALKGVLYRTLERLRGTKPALLDGTILLSEMLREDEIVDELRFRKIDIAALRKDIQAIMNNRPDRLSWEESLRNSPPEFEAILLNALSILERSRSENLSAGILVEAFDSPLNNSAASLLAKHSSSGKG